MKAQILKYKNKMKVHMLTNKMKVLIVTSKQNEGTVL